MITRPNGKPYRPRKVVAWRWENDDAYPVDEGCGAVVLGTHDTERARALADSAIKRWFDGDLIAAKPEVGWFRLGYQGGDLTWLHDEIHGRAGVMFTADYPPSSNTEGASS